MLSPLPPHLLSRAFLVTEALDAGVSPRRLRGSDLAAPFRGVREVAPAATPRPDPLGYDQAAAAARIATELALRCRSLALRLKPETAFSHSTAAVLMGAPLPLALEQHPALHISVFEPHRAPVVRGVVSHQIGRPEAGLAPVVRGIGGLAVTSPPFTWCLLAEQLGVPDLVAVADFMVAGRRTTLDQLAHAVAHRAGHRGVTRLERALSLVRDGARSRRETHARLLYAAAGLPEPELNGTILDARGQFVAMSDLVWRAARVANEYEGKHHQEAGQFRRDVLRRERIEDAGWRLVRITADDLRLRPAETVMRTANRLGVTVSAAKLRRAIALSREFPP